MATKFSIHEDIENALEPTKRITKKVIVGGKSSGVFSDKIQQQRPKLAVLNNVQVNGVRNTTSQKTVSRCCLSISAPGLNIIYKVMCTSSQRSVQLD